jgi:hypothetical protein
LNDPQVLFILFKAPVQVKISVFKCKEEKLAAFMKFASQIVEKAACIDADTPASNDKLNSAFHESSAQSQMQCVVCNIHQDVPYFKLFANCPVLCIGMVPDKTLLEENAANSASSKRLNEYMQQVG